MDPSQQHRYEITLRHIASDDAPQEDDDFELEASDCAAEQPFPRGYVPPQFTQKKVRWNGWGYEDTEFRLNSKGQVYLTGNSYMLSGKVLPNFRPFLERQVPGCDVENVNPFQTSIEFPPAVRNENFIKAIETRVQKFTFDRMECVIHGHGHTAQDVYRLRYSHFERIPDIVIWPQSHEEVEFIVQTAHEHNVVIIPFGGGTSVTEALECPKEETRMIVSLDMRSMNKIKWVDRESLMACIEAGAMGKELETRLNMMGLVLGHEPDSAEFSTLGGWIATRASGMKKNVYGNIEDFLIHVVIVTPTGTIRRSCQVPRMSAGPDIHEIILGSEGMLGVITEATVRVRFLPELRKYGSIAFPDFESGFHCMREVALRRCAPASIRLMDNLQFQMGQCFTPEDNSLLKIGYFTDKLKKLYLTKWAKFDLEKITAATLVFEGTAAEIKNQEKQVYEIAAKYHGIKAGSNNGLKGYFLTYTIAYMRDMGFYYWLIGESFETSVPWSNVLMLCERVKERMFKSAVEHKLPHPPNISYRITQTYDTGCCVYFYFGFIFKGIEDPVTVFTKVEADARDEVLACGGSLSHHHGIGKLRKQWMLETISPTAVEMLRGLKKSVDPKGIMGSRNLFDP